MRNSLSASRRLVTHANTAWASSSYLAWKLSKCSKSPTMDVSARLGESA